MSDFNINSNPPYHYSPSNGPSFPQNITDDMNAIKKAYDTFEHTPPSTQTFLGLKHAIQKLQTDAQSLKGPDADQLRSSIDKLTSDDGILNRVSQEMETSPDKELPGALGAELRAAINDLESKTKP